ncbi:MAG TPA: HEPN domain-containing protein [Chloroflexi bacterium]|nr:HEPN domain-containing protein [Chloroflexota bacterium]
MNKPGKLPEKTPQVWLHYAKGDLAVAEREINSESPVYHTICFLCQGAAEKFLKAYLIAQGWPLKKIHDITDLLKDCMSYDQAFEVLLPNGAILNEYITAGRYPSDLAFEMMGLAEAQEALQATREIRDAVIARISPQR